MSIGTAIARGRTAAEALMVDTCVIKRRTGQTTGAGGVITPTFTTLYTGKCRVQVKTAARQGGDIGQAYVVVEEREVQLPMTVTGLREGDQITITAAALDPDLVGRAYVVHDVVAKTQLTSRRATVLEVTS
jgi:uncharacterized protein YwlG (UPF0340 family)